MLFTRKLVKTAKEVLWVLCIHIPHPFNMCSGKLFSYVCVMLPTNRQPRNIDENNSPVGELIKVNVSYNKNSTAYNKT